MIWQDVLLLTAGGWQFHRVYEADRARRRAGKTIRESVLPRRRDTRIPSVTEVA